MRIKKHKLVIYDIFYIFPTFISKKDMYNRIDLDQINATLNHNKICWTIVWRIFILLIVIIVIKFL